MADYTEQVVIKDILEVVKALNDASSKARELGIEIVLTSEDQHFVGQRSLRTFRAKAVKSQELDLAGVR
ncbi:hypothetical protein IVB45_17465 [Bradyrhizobium sp. 4]|uniref:hypothetical protein n=1 Tax=unclassified Bradyrhizobium TaxID=2631580 RepID=UPI001FF8E517|nr:MULTISPECIES: hypothetical protein [unclassified Bradyrhizobium]MCK1402036.1 hypothetical protein [Bradyrhizobium sp. 39]MCK1751244.1 hypothetical protein [Bradyrhizobium sp. 135]UPJ38498.1 hypothetical protein IVB45_17465 [Bradyrhizobium sp. 4]